MSDLQSIALEAIKANLGALEVSAFESVIADSKKLKQVEETYKAEKKVDEAKIQQLRRDLNLVTSKFEKAQALNNASEQTRLLAEQRLQECAIVQAKAEIYQEDRSRLFDVVGNAYKHYTQTTVRQEVVSGGEYVQDHYGSDGQSRPVTVKAPEMIETVTEQIRSE